MQNSLDERELQHFSSISDKWWDSDGPFAPLHRMNPVRLDYIINQICQYYERDRDNLKPLKGLNIIDIGCGGGLMCEPLARLGAKITGLDADAQAVSVAANHAKQEGLDITYIEATAEKHLEKHKAAYDIVLSLEIIEHIKDQSSFVETCAQLIKPEGLLFVSTLNRTATSYMLSILGAEYILKWLPVGTHTWSSFVKPHELARYIRRSGCRPVDVSGIVYHPFNKQFAVSSSDTRNNYIMTSTREKSGSN